MTVNIGVHVLNDAHAMQTTVDCVSYMHNIYLTTVIT